jgi:hypothetical protein
VNTHETPLGPPMLPGRREDVESGGCPQGSARGGHGLTGHASLVWYTMDGVAKYTCLYGQSHEPWG